MAEQRRVGKLWVRHTDLRQAPKILRAQERQEWMEAHRIIFPKVPSVQWGLLPEGWWALTFRALQLVEERVFVKQHWTGAVPLLREERGAFRGSRSEGDLQPVYGELPTINTPGATTSADHLENKSCKIKYIYIYIYTHIYAYTHTYIYTYIHIIYMKNRKVMTFLKI